MALLAVGVCGRTAHTHTASLGCADGMLLQAWLDLDLTQRRQLGIQRGSRAAPET